MTRGEPIYTDGNDDEAEEVLTRKNAVTGATEPATGLTGLTFRLSATKGGTAIDSTLSKNATERGTTGRYFAIFEGNDLATQLNNAAFWNVDVFQVFGDGSNINYNVVRRVLQKRP
jgi:hypothetical protein